MLMLVDTEDNPGNNLNQPPKVEDITTPPFDGLSQSSDIQPPTSPVDVTPPAPNPFPPTTPPNEQPSPQPVTPAAVSDHLAQTAQQNEPAAPSEPTVPPTVKNSKSKLRGIAKVVLLIIVIVGLCGGAYLFGKHHERVVVRAPSPLPINLPPQAVVLNACVAGRGKQYIIPKDIPTGPIYDVLDSKVIAVEYNLNIQQLFSDSDTFSNAILGITKNYSVDHFSLLPAGATSATSQPTSIHLIMFTVSKSVANAITCGNSAP